MKLEFDNMRQLNCLKTSDGQILHAQIIYIMLRIAFIIEDNFHFEV